MANKTVAQIVGNIVDELGPLSSDERKRVVQAALTLLGEEAVASSAAREDETVGLESIHARAKNWMKQNDLSAEQLHEAFLFGDGNVQIIGVPGSNKKEQTRNAYILIGVSRFLTTGEQKFDDAPARALCERFGFYDSTNHARYTRGSNDFVGSREAGWTITQPGLKSGAALIKTISHEG